MLKKFIVLIAIIAIVPKFVFSQGVNRLENIAIQYQSGQISQDEAIKQAKASQGGVNNMDLMPTKIGTDENLLDKLTIPTVDSVKPLKTKKIFNKVKYFGYDLFNASKSKFVNIDIGSVPSDYILVPGDNLIVTMWGQTELRKKLSISRDGTIFIKRYGQMMVAGLTMAKLERKLIKNLSKIYNGLMPTSGTPNTFLDITLGKIQKIQIYVIGNVNHPGAHSVSSFSSIFSSLYAVGGPTINGSLRDIKLIRNGKEISTTDIYSFLLDGKNTGNVRLHNNDIILVPPRISSILLRGEVKQSAYYELKSDETLKDLIKFSGGLKTLSEMSKVQIERVLSLNKRKNRNDIYEVLKPNFVKFSDTVFSINPIKLFDQDIITVMPITKLNDVAVQIPGFLPYYTVTGHVYKPGKYVLGNKFTIKQALEKAGGLDDSVFFKQTYTVRADLYRFIGNQMEREIIPVSIDNLLRGCDTCNYVLQNRDSIVVYSQSILVKKRYVSILGEVEKTGEFLLKKNMNLKDLIIQAGGFSKDAYLLTVDVFRLNKDASNNQLSSAYNVKMEENTLNKFTDKDKFILNDYDVVVVRKDPNLNPHELVTIDGEVKFPGIYSILSRDETINSLIDRAGGLKSSGFVAGLRFMRGDSIRVVGDFEAILKGENQTVTIRNHDHIYIPKHPGTVKVAGEVRNPGLVQYHKDWSLKKYIDAAGNVNITGSRYHSIVYYAGGNAKRKKFLINPRVAEGATVYVPKRKERQPVNITQLLTSWASIAASFATVFYIVRIK